jgi:hypothetical protein
MLDRTRQAFLLAQTHPPAMSGNTDIQPVCMYTNTTEVPMSVSTDELVN